MKKTFIIISGIILTIGLFYAGDALAADTWKLKGSAQLNPNDEITHFEGGGAMEWFGEERFLGKTHDYTITETSITFKDREYDRGEYWNVTFVANFTAPPATLTTGDTITLPASVSGSGSITEGGGGQSGIQFQYNLNGSVIEDSYIATNLDFVNDSSEASFVVPAVTEGGTLTISAGLWNCAACQVVWEYEPGTSSTTNTNTSTNVNTNTNTNSVNTNALTNPFSGEVEELENPCLQVWLQDDIEKAKALPGGVTIIKEIVGTVEVLREGDTEWTPAQPMMILQPGEAIRTGPNSDVYFIVKKVIHESDEAYIPYEIKKRENLEELARNAYLRDNGTLADSFEILYGWMKAISSFEFDWSKYKPQLGWIEENSIICTGEFYDPNEKGYLELLEGAIHNYTTSWNDGIFSVKAGTTHCGIRGSETYVYYDPDTDEVAAYVKEGHMDVTDTNTGEKVSLTDMQKVTYQDGELGEVKAMSIDQWNFLAVSTNSEEEIDEATEADEYASQALELEDDFLADRVVIETSTVPDEKDIMKYVGYAVGGLIVIVVLIIIYKKRKDNN